MKDQETKQKINIRRTCRRFPRNFPSRKVVCWIGHQHTLFQIATQMGNQCCASSAVVEVEDHHDVADNSSLSSGRHTRQLNTDDDDVQRINGIHTMVSFSQDGERHKAVSATSHSGTNLPPFATPRTHHRSVTFPVNSDLGTFSPLDVDVASRRLSSGNRRATVEVPAIVVGLQSNTVNPSRGPRTPSTMDDSGIAMQPMRLPVMSSFSGREDDPLGAAPPVSSSAAPDDFGSLEEQPVLSPSHRPPSKPSSQSSAPGMFFRFKHTNEIRPTAAAYKRSKTQPRASGSVSPRRSLTVSAAERSEDDDRVLTSSSLVPTAGGDSGNSQSISVVERVEWNIEQILQHLQGSSDLITMEAPALGAALGTTTDCGSVSCVRSGSSHKSARELSFAASRTSLSARLDELASAGRREYASNAPTAAAAGHQKDTTDTC